MEIKKLEWDSQFFGFSVGNIFIREQKNEPIILNSDDYTLIQLKSIHPIEVISNTHHFSYEETRIIFSKDLVNIPKPDYPIINFDENPIAESLFYDLALESGKHSRYRLDENFSDQQFIDLYKLWIKNSINKTFADKIFYIKENENVKGFITLKIKNESKAEVGLIAVSPNVRRKGLGTILLQNIEYFCNQNHIKKLYIKTHLENINASIFYSKMNYEKSGKIILKNYWKKTF